jgi:hypothetical protein
VAAVRFSVGCPLVIQTSRLPPSAVPDLSRTDLLSQSVLQSGDVVRVAFGGDPESARQCSRGGRPVSVWIVRPRSSCVAGRSDKAGRMCRSTPVALPVCSPKEGLCVEDGASRLLGSSACWWRC